MGLVLVDSNVLLDILTEDPTWYKWSSTQLEKIAQTHQLAINPIIYAEISVGFSHIETLETCLPPTTFARLALPWDAAFLAGKAFLHYKKNKGAQKSTMPDFFIGAHAMVNSLTLLTRDGRRYLTYFPKIQLIAPE